MKIKLLFLFLSLLSLMEGCKVGRYYWNAEIFNNGNQVRLINMLFGQSFFYLNFLPAKDIDCREIELISFSGTIKYALKNDSIITVEIIKNKREALFSKYEIGMREDGKDAIFAFCGLQLGCGYEQRIEPSLLKEIRYAVKGEISLPTHDTLHIESHGVLNAGNWEGNWKGK